MSGVARGRVPAARRLALGLLLAASAVAGCKPEIPTDPDVPPGVRFLDLTGEWLYTATGVRPAGSPGSAPCEVTGAVLELVKIKGAGAFSGTSSGGEFVCTGELSFLSGPLTAYPIGNGYTFNQYVSFDFGTPDWRHDGLVTSTDSATIDSMSGSFKLHSGGVTFEGTFSAVRRGR